MITGFLFFSKLIDGRTKSIDWGKLFVSRFLRLVPLYLFAMLLLFLIVAYLSNGILNEPIPKLLNEAIQWLSFTIFGGPNLNGVANTFIITAGVTWSLPYEWIFYLSLPLLALTVRVIPPLPYIALSIAAIAGLAIWHPHFHALILVPFSGGITASFLVRWDSFRQFAARRISSFISLGCIAIAVTFYPSAFEIVPLLLLSVAFTLIACGNNLFGVLVSPVSRTLGEMAYSIYLLHGITLFVAFNFILGVGDSKALSPITHWLVVAGITPVLVFVCFLTFRYIESPAMRSTTTFTAWLRSRAAMLSKGASQAEHP
jgi:peptidoglycan/LPS O-acetylase OafA/YrhL